MRQLRIVRVKTAGPLQNDRVAGTTLAVGSNGVVELIELDNLQVVVRGSFAEGPEYTVWPGDVSWAAPLLPFLPSSPSGAAPRDTTDAYEARLAALAPALVGADSGQTLISLPTEETEEKEEEKATKDDSKQDARSETARGHSAPRQGKPGAGKRTRHS